MIESITSYIFGKVADFALSSLMTKLDIKDKEDRKKIEKAIKDFKKQLTDRHIENPYYEDVISLWEEHQVCEELLKICYKRYRSDSKFKSYSEFKEYLSEKFEERTAVKDFSNNLMDELEKCLYDTVKDTSNFTQADMAAMHSMITEPIINEIHKLPENNSSFTQRVPENNKTTRQQLEQEKTKSLPLNSDFNVEKEVDEIKRILQEYFLIGNYKENLQKFFSDGYKNYYPVKKKEQHFTFDEKFTAIEQHYNGVDQLYAIFEFIIDLYSEIKSQNKFVSFYVTSKKFKQIEESGWIPENDDETEIWKETIKHISLADQYEALLKRLYYSLDKTNHKLITLENGNKIIVEKNAYASEVSQILSESNMQDAIKVLEYNHFANKGNIHRKKEILLSLAGYLEPYIKAFEHPETLPKELKDIYNELKIVLQTKGAETDKKGKKIPKKIAVFDNLSEMYNKGGLRHNNDKQYHLNMNDEELEQWYDNIYSSTLFVILSLEMGRNLSKLNELKKK